MFSFLKFSYICIINFINLKRIPYENRKGLEILVSGCQPSYDVFDYPLVKKAEHEYSDQYNRTRWSKLSSLTEEELYELYLICRNSLN